MMHIDPPYDSTVDTLKHKHRVQQLLTEFATELLRRGVVHDDSKLGPEEKPYFDKATPKLKDVTFGTPEYRAALAEIKPATDHHNANNSHHPEFYGMAGVYGMDLADLVEMFFDWKASSERHEDGNIARSITICSDRFAIDPMISAIFMNTARNLGWLAPKDDRVWHDYTSLGSEYAIQRTGDGQFRHRLKGTDTWIEGRAPKVVK